MAVTCGTPRPSTPREVHAAPGPTPINTAAGAAFHDFESHVVANSVANDHWDAHVAAKFCQIERFIFGRDVPRGRNRALNNENIGASFLRDRAEILRRVAESN